MWAALTLRISLDHNPSLAIRAHGWPGLAPFRYDRGDSIEWPVDLPVAGPMVVTVGWDASKRTVEVVDPPVLDPDDQAFLSQRLSWMFRAGESFEEFWGLCEGDEALEAARNERAGALIRAGTLFEDVVKVLCTVNCTWGNTVRMVANLCEMFGRPVVDAEPAAFTFPAPAALAGADESALREAKLGFRAPWIRGFASVVASGELDLNSWLEVADSAELRKRLMELPGVGPYAANHILVTLGHYGFIPSDTTVASHLGLPPGTPTAEIESAAAARYEAWGRYAFLAMCFGRMFARH